MDRKQQRRDFDVRLAVDSPTTRGVSGRSRDLSDGGFGATFTRPLRLGEMLQVSFLLGTEVLTVEAVVRYVRGFRHGLEFRRMSRSEKLMLWRFCNRGGWQNRNWKN